MAERHKDPEIFKKSPDLEEKIVLSNVIDPERLNEVRSILENGKVEVSKDTKEAFKRILEKIFSDRENMKKIGAEEYLKSNSAEFKTLGAVARLEDTVERVQNESRELSSKEIDEIKDLFEKAVMSWRQENNDAVANDLEEVFENMDVLIEILEIEKRN